MTWITNSPEYAERLRAIDGEYAAAMVRACACQTLATKLAAIRHAKETKRAGYEAIRAELERIVNQ